MDLKTALQMVWDRSARSSQRRVAEEMGVQPSALSRWKSGEEPQGKLREQLFAWAERVAPSPEAPITAAEYDAVIAAVVATGENRARLGVVQGYAQFVLDQLADLVRRQQAVVDGIRPFAEAEGQALAANVPPEQIPELLASIRRYQARTATDAPGDPQQGTG